MASERSRYMRRNRGPSIPIEMSEMRDLLPSVGVDRLSEILWLRAEGDEVLRKALMTSVCLSSSSCSWEQAKAATEYALNFPDYVRETESGHDLIIFEIQSSLEVMIDRGHQELALKVARLAVELAQGVAENFESDWEWVRALDELNAWIENMNKGSGGA